ELFEDYRRRIAWPVALSEVEERRKLPPERLRAREAELLLAALPKAKDLCVVALDERGRTFDSAGFAARLAAWRDEGVSDIAFLIGGAEGHGEAVRARADLVLSLGAMTWPHLLVRGLLAEQLYRAQQILSGHPYHRA
ncbi:MAG: 23S rRNA (pseudouridine(1915)-N(3))-methyltransferase RlmH, partial [Dongiaceae bacterium]